MTDCKCPPTEDSFLKTLERDIKRPSRVFTPKINRFLLSLLISILIVLPIYRKVTFMSMITVFLMTFIMFILISNMYGDNLIGSLPYSTYPTPPHLGLDGVPNSMLV